MTADANQRNDVDLKARNQNRNFSTLEVIDRVDEVYDSSEVHKEVLKDGEHTAVLLL